MRSGVRLIPNSPAGGDDGGVGSTGVASAPPKSMRGDGADGRARVVQDLGVDDTENDVATDAVARKKTINLMTITFRVLVSCLMINLKW